MSREALDDLRSDMAAHQRERAHVDVTDQSNHRLAADLLERIDREQADSKAPPPKPVQDWNVNAVDVGPDPLVRKATPQEHWFVSHAMPRLQLLLEKRESGPLGAPSWRTRALAGPMYFKEAAARAKMAGRHDMAREFEERAFFELVELLEQSSASFGDWKKDPDPKVTVG